jgi:hypothetical protein
MAASMAASAQVNNASFENWSNLATHVYESEMINDHQVPDPMHGDIDGWTEDYSYGISRTTDAADGNYAIILHNWYNYAQTSLIYRGEINNYPVSISGMYKYVSADVGDTAFAHIIIKNSMDEPMIEKVYHFGRDTEWTAFTIPLDAPLSTQYPADSVYMLFHNALTACDGNIMTCNLLFLDKIEVQAGSAGLNTLDASKLRIFPNPAQDHLTIEWTEQAENDRYTWEIIDMSGRVQLHGDLGNSLTELNVSQLVPGAYMVKISDQQHTIQREQILIR